MTVLMTTVFDSNLISAIFCYGSNKTSPKVNYRRKHLQAWETCSCTKNKPRLTKKNSRKNLKCFLFRTDSLLQGVGRVFQSIIPEYLSNEDLNSVNLLKESLEADLQETGTKSREGSVATLSHSSSILSRILEDDILKDWINSIGEENAMRPEENEGNDSESDTLSVLSDATAMAEAADFDVPVDDSLENSQQTEYHDDKVMISGEDVQQTNRLSVVIESKKKRKRVKKLYSSPNLSREAFSLERSPLGEYPEKSEDFFRGTVCCGLVKE